MEWVTQVGKDLVMATSFTCVRQEFTSVEVGVMEELARVMGSTVALVTDRFCNQSIVAVAELMSLLCLRQRVPAGAPLGSQ